jgi:predicted unusual protein kinase regulating ubiquinone biosynthesis (AarF/ABC1/UbiB family)
LGPTFAKLGQILSTRPDLLPTDFIEELSSLQDRVAPLSESEVVRLMEQELKLPWDVWCSKCFVSSAEGLPTGHAGPP